MANHADDAYHSLLKYVLNRGELRQTRNGPTRSIFGFWLGFDLTDTFPLLTTKKLHTHSIVGELAWMLRGETNVRGLHEHGVSIWDEWADEVGELGPVYGSQWRNWGGFSDGDGFDQIKTVVENLKADPTSRRHIVSAWNVSDLGEMALAPCHTMFQFYVRGDGHLDCLMFQRSADVFLGLPFNIASYALLTHLVARTVGLKAGSLAITLGDVHLYENHVEQAQLQLLREPYEGPHLAVAEQFNLFDLDPRHVHFMNYNAHPAIPAPVSV